MAGWAIRPRSVFISRSSARGGKKVIWSLDLNTLEHTPSEKPRFDSIGKVKDIEDLGERLKALLAESDKAAELVKALTYQSFQYASVLLPEVADTGKPIDDAITWGFVHAAGPFETWDMLGVKEVVEQMKAAGYAPADWVEDMLKAGNKTFYQYSGNEQDRCL